jgi:hypothetical protein
MSPSLKVMCPLNGTFGGLLHPHPERMILQLPQTHAWYRRRAHQA